MTESQRESPKWETSLVLTMVGSPILCSFAWKYNSCKRSKRHSVTLCCRLSLVIWHAEGKGRRRAGGRATAKRVSDATAVAIPISSAPSLQNDELHWVSITSCWWYSASAGQDRQNVGRKYCSPNTALLLASSGPDPQQERERLFSRISPHPPPFASWWHGGEAAARSSAASD